VINALLSGKGTGDSWSAVIKRALRVSPSASCSSVARPLMRVAIDHPYLGF
jgi:hypothetical protein